MNRNSFYGKFLLFKKEYFWFYFQGMASMKGLSSFTCAAFLARGKRLRFIIVRARKEEKRRIIVIQKQYVLQRGHLFEKDEL